MILPRTGQRKVGSAPVASLALTGVTASSGCGLACANRALCRGAALATLVPATGTVVTAGAAATAPSGVAGAGAAAAVLAGTVSLVPSLSLAEGSILLARESSATEM